MRCLFVILCLVAVPVLDAQVTPLAMQFHSDRVVVSGATPYTLVTWHSVTLRSEDFVVRSEANPGIGFFGKNGSVSIPWQEAPRSIWVAVELATGRLIVAGPGSYQFRQVAPPADLVPPPIKGLKIESSALPKVGGHAEVYQCFSQPRQYVEMLLVRPAVWAWRLTAHDGDARDMNPDNGVIRSCLDGFAPLPVPPPPRNDGDIEPPQTPPPAPIRFAPRDLLIGINPDRMTYYVLELDVRS